MLTKGKTSKFRAVKYVAMVLALVAVFAFCLTACGKAAPVSAEYVAGTLTKGTYNQGETFDCTGAQIKITYDKGEPETVDVTTAMVGEVVLNTVGQVGVNVTYSTEGGSVTAIIPVTVVDPYAADKDAAIKAINANATVTANVDDKGIETLVSQYTADIKAATSKTAIDTLKANFETKVTEYVNAKTEARNAVNGVNYDQFYPQFLVRAEATKAETLDAIDAATTVAAVNAIKNTFVDNMTKLLAEQKFYIESTDNVNPDNLTPGQIADKIAILTSIENYQALIAERQELVEANGDPANVSVYIAKYEMAIDQLDWWYKYVNLTINLDGVQKKVDLVAADALRTPIDDIYDAIRDVLYNKADGTYTDDVLADGVGITVIPAPYIADEANPGQYILDTDTIGDLIAQIDADYAEAVTEFGSTLAEQMYVDYTVLGTEIKINLKDYVQELKDSYDVLVDIQTDAEAIIDLIDAIETAADDTAKEAAVIAAWDALKTWGTDNDVFSLDATVTAFLNNLVFDLEYAEGVYTVTQGETDVTKEWTAYDFTEEYMVTYFVPNFEELVEATIKIDAEYILNHNIPEDIVFSYTAIDSEAAIDEADANRTAFIDNYGMEIYEKYCLEDVDGTATDVLLNTINAANKEYDELVVQAKELNDMITALPNAEDIVIDDYNGEEPALKFAYDAYIAFAERNNEGTILHTDVIANVDNAGTTDNEAKLLACVDKYIELAFAEQKEVIGLLVISTAYNARVDINTGDVSVNDTAFRTALATYTLNEYNELKAVAYDATGVDNFNRMEIFATNIQHVTEVAEASAKIITDAQSAADLI